MLVYAFYFNRRMNRALRASRDRIGDINAQVEDTLAGIRVVKSFTNEDDRTTKICAREQPLCREPARCLSKVKPVFYSGMMAFTQLLTVAVIVFGGCIVTARWIWRIC